jgi:hypothetical protein
VLQHAQFIRRKLVLQEAIGVVVFAEVVGRQVTALNGLVGRVANANSQPAIALQNEREIVEN